VPFRAGNAFPVFCRLHCRSEYDLAWKRGRKLHCGHFLVIVLQKNCGPTRLGLTVSRKIGGAVARNRIKRLLREYFRLAYDSLPASVDFSIVAKKGAEKLDFEGVAMELRLLQSLQRTQSTSC
jgi:ribonuclease P protein component